MDEEVGSTFAPFLRVWRLPLESASKRLTSLIRGIGEAIGLSMSNILDWRVFFGIGLLICGASLGCAQREKPVPFSEYGETIDRLPVVQDLPSSFPILDEIEKKECNVREEVEGHARRVLFESQGRTMELGEEEHDHEH